MNIQNICIDKKQPNIRNELKINQKPLLNSILQQSFYNQYLMEYQARICNKPKNYAKIPLNKRIKLVELVLQKAFSIAKASAKLGIRPSTAKLILKKFREQGAFFEKRSDKLARLATFKQHQEPSPSIIVQQTPLLTQNSNEMRQFYTMPYLSYGAYTGMQAMNIDGEWNRMQNYSLGGFLNFGLMQQLPQSGFFF